MNPLTALGNVVKDLLATGEARTGTHVAPCSCAQAIEAAMAFQRFDVLGAVAEDPALFSALNTYNLTADVLAHEPRPAPAAQCHAADRDRAAFLRAELFPLVPENHEDYIPGGIDPP